MKDIAGYEKKYAITPRGEIWAYPRPKGSRGKPHNGLWMKFRIKPNGYLEVCLRDGHKAKYHLVHRLVAKTYLGEPPEGTVVNHKNGIKQDNQFLNLEWITRKENVHHARDVLGAYIGERNGRYIDGRRMKVRA